MNVRAYEIWDNKGDVNFVNPKNEFPFWVVGTILLLMLLYRMV